jgi:uncharacterized LabA/DUF88 family protein
MIIYSEVLGKQFKTIEECVAAEKEYEKKLKEEAQKQENERQALEKRINEAYKRLVKDWTEFMDCLEESDVDIESMQDKALLCVEVILDAERKRVDRPKS